MAPADPYAFAPAAPDEETVYGACRPRHPRTPRDSGVPDWIDFVRERGIERVCCLLDDEHLSAYADLLGSYREAFGADRVCHAPIPDFAVVDRGTLHDSILPFLHAADRNAEPVVVHCSAGSGRTGHLLALWLVCGRGVPLDRAVETVRRTGRRPLEAAEREDLERLCSGRD